ncbi:hypothetical protein SH668x_000743 [Planctomicrobium sp. SH668]|uniref:hypothetical protein n=1 Tax=Planctomicrobium sp. SH668 TaxID=3448126 RepID=UPI003F5CB58D
MLVRLREADQTASKVISFVNKIQPGVGDQFSGLTESLLGQAIGVPVLAGVDQTRDWYLGVYLSKESTPRVVFAIPALDADELQQSFQRDMESQVKKNWVIYSEETDEPLPIAASVQESIAQTANASNLKRFNEGDFTVFLNLNGIREAYQDFLDLAEDQALKGVSQSMQQAEMPQAASDYYSATAASFVEGTFQFLKDANQGVLTISLDDAGLSIKSQTSLNEGSESSKFLSGLTQSSMPLLNVLPGKQQAYVGVSGGIKEMFVKSLELSSELVDKETLKEELKAAIDSYKTANFGTAVMALNISESNSGAFRAISIFEMDQIEQMKKMARLTPEIAASVPSPGIKTSVELIKDAETYGEFKADVLTQKQEFVDDNANTASQRKFLETFMGKEGLSSRYLYESDRVISTVGGGEAAMKSLVKSMATRKINELQNDRERLPKEANLFAFVDFPRQSGAALSLISKLDEMPIKVDSRMVNSLNLKPSFVGVAIGSEENQLQAEIYVPVEQIIGTVKLGVLLGAAAQGQGGF